MNNADPPEPGALISLPMEENEFSPMSELSNELLLEIAKNLGTESLRHMCLVSSRMQAICQQVLHSSVVLENPSFTIGESSPSISNFTRTIIARPDLARRTRELKFYISDYYTHDLQQLEPIQVLQICEIWADLGYLLDPCWRKCIEEGKQWPFVGVILALLPQLQSFGLSSHPDGEIIPRSEYFPEQVWKHPRMRGLRQLVKLELQIETLNFLIFDLRHLKRLDLTNLCAPCLRQGLDDLTRDAFLPRLEQITLSFDCCQNEEAPHGYSYNPEQNLTKEIRKTILTVNTCLGCAKLQKLGLLFPARYYLRGLCMLPMIKLGRKCWPQLEGLKFTFDADFGWMYHSRKYAFKYNLFENDDTCVASIGVKSGKQDQVVRTHIAEVLQQLPTDLRILKIKRSNGSIFCWIQSLQELRSQFTCLESVIFKDHHFDSPIRDPLLQQLSASRANLEETGVRVSIV